ncbi:MAG: SPOR domain-containing protein [Arcobacteraceae bacterium]
MEVDGKEFLRNVGIEQDKERLIQEQRKLEELKRASVKREESYAGTQAPDEEPAFVDLSLGNEPPHPNNANSVDDIILDTTTQNNKKKYIMLGFGLILLFIITVLVIRLISNSDTQSQLNGIQAENTETAQDDILNKIDSNEAYQNVIDKQNALDESNRITQSQKTQLNEINIPEDEEVDNVPLVIDTPKAKEEAQRDLFELEKQAQNTDVNKPVATVKKATPRKVQSASQPKRKIALPSAKERNLSTKSTSLGGYYIQIGAFTKAPSQSLLDSITKKGYEYKIHKMLIKGKLYTKVLIGSYTQRADASKVLNQVRKDFNNPSAYILKF